MLSTIQLLLALGAGRTALVADLVLTAVAGGIAAAVITRSHRRSPAVTDSVVAEAEAVVHEAAARQPA